MLQEDFEGLSLGDINGQGSYTYFASWATALSGTSTAEVVSDGSRCIKLIGDAGAGSQYASLVLDSDLNFDLWDGLRLHFRMKTDDVGMGTKGVAIGTGTATPLCQIYYRNSTTDQLTFYNATTNTKLVETTDNTWAEIDMFIVCTGATTSVCIVYIDGVYIGAYATGAHALGVPWLYFNVYDNPSTAGSDSWIEVDDIWMTHTSFMSGIGPTGPVGPTGPAGTKRVMYFTVSYPGAATIPLGVIEEAWTAAKIEAYIFGGTNVVFNIEERTTPGTAGTNMMTSDMTALTTLVTDAALANPGLAAGNTLALDIASVSGAVTYIAITISE